jgi:hypothetical protein
MPAEIASGMQSAGIASGAFDMPIIESISKI